MTFVHATILQENGKAMPCLTATLIDRLPHKEDPNRPMEGRLAQELGVEVYIGRWCKWTCSQWTRLLTLVSSLCQVPLIL